jgi:microcystin-dependent protein
MNYVGRAPANPASAPPPVVTDNSPIGAIIFSHGAPDASWLVCNGQTVSKATYPLLWTRAQSFLTTDQVTNPGLFRNVDAANFALPNLQGLFIRGTGQVDASHVAAALGVKQAAQMPAHTHTGGQAAQQDVDFAGTGSNVWRGASGSTGSAGTGTEPRPVNVALVPLIKALSSV